MAKLGARGATILWKMAHSDYGDRIALRSDRKVLRQYVGSDGQVLGGWAIRSTLKEGVTPEQAQRKFEQDGYRTI